MLKNFIKMENLSKSIKEMIIQRRQGWITSQLNHSDLVVLMTNNEKDNMVVHQETVDFDDKVKQF